MTSIPEEYAHLTPRDLVRLYGSRPDECPAALRGWLRAALLLDETIELRRQNERLEAEIRARRN